MTRKKKLLFALATVVLILGGSVAVAIAADLVLHYRAERSAGTNRWGYRGPVVAAKKSNEVRIVMLGGSTVFGYGVLWQESIPALLEKALNQHQQERQWTVINLGYNTEGAFAFLPNLRDYEYLAYDLVILYEGYNDMLGDGSPNHAVVRHQSPVFRATGYFPILPLWLTERSRMLASGGTVGAGYQAQAGEAEKTVFRPSLANRAGASALDGAAAVARALEKQFERAGSETVVAVPSGTTDCPAPWVDYCESERRAIQYSLDAGKKVLVVSQPHPKSGAMRVRHLEQQDAVAQMVARVFGATPRVGYFAVGDRVDLSDSSVSFDQMHLNADGNRMVADVLREPVLQLWSKS